jgi:hypothetical protein
MAKRVQKPPLPPNFLVPLISFLYFGNLRTLALKNPTALGRLTKSELFRHFNR